MLLAGEPWVIEELAAVYDAARLLVVPSFAEGFGLQALEAAGRGAVVLASQTTPVREFLGRAVLCSDPHSFAQPADLLALVWYDAGVRQRLGQAGWAACSGANLGRRGTCDRGCLRSVARAPFTDEA
ncbi:MAG: glycosyltransferase [Candidatus Andersenbacteria bacterium]